MHPEERRRVSAPGRGGEQSPVFEREETRVDKKTKTGSLIYRMWNLGVCVIRKCCFSGLCQPPRWQTDATKTLANAGVFTTQPLKASSPWRLSFIDHEARPGSVPARLPGSQAASDLFPLACVDAACC